MLLVMSCEYINTLMNVYMSCSACSGSSHNRVQAQSPLKFRDVGGEDLVVDVVEPELSLLLSLDDVSRSDLLQLVIACRFRALEQGTNSCPVHFPSPC